jgi:hypothetical protein
MSNSLHIYFETGAIGDTAFNLCRANIAMQNRNHDDCIVHTSPIFRFGNPTIEIPSNPDVSTILNKTNFIREIVFDVDYKIAESFIKSQKYNCEIYQPNEYRKFNNILEWIDLKEYHLPCETTSKTAIFQPISLQFKPRQHLEDYIPVWTRCIETVLQNGYEIFMVGGANDDIDQCIPKNLMKYLNNKINLWSPLNSLAFLLYRSDIVISCDSWAAIWGIAARKPTAVAWGYRMENNIDFWATNFLGNKDCYKYGWSSQKDFCDIYLAQYLNSIKLNQQKKEH